MSSVGLCAVVLQDNIFLPWTFVSKPKIQLLEHLKAMSSIDGFTLWQKLIKYESFSIPKDSSHGLKGSGYCFWLLFFGSVVHQSNTQRWLSSTGGKNANYKMGEVHNVEKE
jgi:hypothetical protein